MSLGLATLRQVRCPLGSLECSGREVARRGSRSSYDHLPRKDAGLWVKLEAQGPCSLRGVLCTSAKSGSTVYQC